MKRIGIDARLIAQTGVGVYIRNLLHYLDTSDNDIEYYVYVYPADFKYIPERPGLSRRAASYRWHSVDEQTRFLNLLRKDKLDLMHFTYFSFPYFYNRPFVITIHDLTPLLFKTGRATTLPSPLFQIKHTGYQQLLKRGISKAQSVIVPSESVKKDITTLFGKTLGDKISVTYEGIDIELSKMKEDGSVLKQVTKPFFLYVGNSYPHKNVENLLRAFSKLADPIQLILVGPKDFFSSKITEFIQKNKLDSRVIQLFNISQEQKIALYKSAQALVQPSLSEGFGLPLIEAQYFNCPVIASNIVVFDEILPKDTNRFDPLNIDSIVNALRIASRSKPASAKLNTNRFSFEKMTKETQNIYHRSLHFGRDDSYEI